MTKARIAVLGALEDARLPLSALDVVGRIGPLCDQATVYRSLSYLENAGKAESFVLHCEERGTERYYVACRAGHRHWLHCERCHSFVDLGECRIEPLLKAIEDDSGVSIRTHTLYATGLCRRCGGRASAEPSSPAV